MAEALGRDENLPRDRRPYKKEILGQIIMKEKIKKENVMIIIEKIVLEEEVTIRARRYPRRTWNFFQLFLYSSSYF